MPRRARVYWGGPMGGRFRYMPSLPAGVMLREVFPSAAASMFSPATIVIGGSIRKSDLVSGVPKAGHAMFRVTVADETNTGTGPKPGENIAIGPMVSMYFLRPILKLIQQFPIITSVHSPKAMVVPAPAVS